MGIGGVTVKEGEFLAPAEQFSLFCALEIKLQEETGCGTFLNVALQYAGKEPKYCPREI